MNEIFLNYRRDDEPGYVARLADSLTKAFGEVVFRDVDSIDGGSNWRVELQKQVSQSQIMIAVIGRRWQTLLSERDPEHDHLRYELELAHSLQIPIIPVQMESAQSVVDNDLGSLSWLNGLQFFELSDRQGRWTGDMERLVEIIARKTSLVPLERALEDSSKGSYSKKLLGIGVATVLAFGILLSARLEWVDSLFSRGETNTSSQIKEPPNSITLIVESVESGIEKQITVGKNARVETVAQVAATALGLPKSPGHYILFEATELARIDNMSTSTLNPLCGVFAESESTGPKDRLSQFISTSGTRIGVIRRNRPMERCVRSEPLEPVTMSPGHSGPRLADTLLFSAVIPVSNVVPVMVWRWWK